MENKSFYKIFESLPVEAQRQAIMFIDFLKDKYSPRDKKVIDKKSFVDSKFIGMWQNRSELKDSSLWIKKLRIHDWK